MVGREVDGQHVFLCMFVFYIRLMVGRESLTKGQIDGRLRLPYRRPDLSWKGIRPKRGSICLVLFRWMVGREVGGLP